MQIRGSGICTPHDAVLGEFGRRCESEMCRVHAECKAYGEGAGWRKLGCGANSDPSRLPVGAGIEALEDLVSLAVAIEFDILGTCTRTCTPKSKSARPHMYM